MIPTKETEFIIQLIGVLLLFQITGMHIKNEEKPKQKKIRYGLTQYSRRRTKGGQFWGKKQAK